MATLILNSGRCGWGKCIFCGYGKIYRERTAEEIKKIFDKFFSEIKDKEVKIFGSGSFLDEKQIPYECFEYFIKLCKEKKIEKITLESRPEYIKKEKILKLKETNAEIYIAIGLECADDKILRKINKGFILKDFEKAVELLHSLNCKVRVYLLVNLPIKNFEKYLEKSVNYALKYADSIVLINLLPHENSEIFNLWIKGEWNFLSKEEFFKITKKWESDKIELDAETFKFIPKFPEKLKEKIVGANEYNLTHPYYEVFQDYLCRYYKKPKEKKFVLFLPCSAKKPYSLSNTHKKIYEILNKFKKFREITHEVVISNPGVIPIEFENFYPFNSYDWNEKEENEIIKKRYIEVTKERIKRYLKSQNYERIFCFLKYTETYKALKLACEELNLKFVNFLKIETYEKIKNIGNPIISQEALHDLEEGIKKLNL